MNRSTPTKKYRTGLVTIVVPAKDEAEAIGQTLRSLPLSTLQAAGFGTEVLLLDGNSRDGTAEIARRFGAEVITDAEPGKGSAFRNAKDQIRGDYIVMIDADGTYASDAIPRAISPLAWDEADIVMGARRALDGSMNGMHRLGNTMLTLGASMLYGRNCADLCTGLWAFRREALRALPLTSRGFELEAELFSLASRMDLRIEHVPVDYLPRKGETKLNTTRDGLRIGWCLLRTRFAPLPPERGQVTRIIHVDQMPVEVRP